LWSGRIVIKYEKQITPGNVHLWGPLQKKYVFEGGGNVELIRIRISGQSVSIGIFSTIGVIKATGKELL
jgi:hypothetical protein